MSTAAMTRDALAPRQPPGLRAGLVLAVIAHVLLILALAWSVNWHASEPEGVVAELWATTPQFAAPRAAAREPKAPTPTPTPPVTPPPTPRPAVEPTRPPPRPAETSRTDAQIAVARAASDAARRRDLELAQRKEQERKEQKEAERQRLAEAQQEKREQAAKSRQEEARLAASRDAYLKRMMGQAGATGPAEATGRATQTAGPSSGWAGRIKARIKPNIVLPAAVAGNPLASVEVRLAPDGTIVGRRLVQSGGAAWDEAVLRAIDKTEVLPRDVDGRVQPVVVIDFKPLE